LFTSVGLAIGEHHRINATALQVRQTTDEVQTDTGILGSGEFERLRSLEWIENELRVGQINGEHSLPRLHDLLLSWQYTKAEASREAPNSREQRFSFNENTESFRVDVFGFEQRFESLQDDAEEYKFDLRMPFEFSENIGFAATAGLTDLQKSRNSRVRRFRFSTSGPQFNSENPEEFFNEGTIGTGFRDYRLLDRTLPTDSYTATVDLQAHYLAFDAYWNKFRLYVGAREEQILQEVVTVTPFDPNATPQIGRVDEKDRLPAATLTWAYSEKAQLRLAFGESVSRPDIREQSPANFIDPLLDLRVVGNPDLKQAAIESLDLRWEYYFSATESLSLALFQKDFTDPIELVESPASGTLLNIINADSAVNRGFEIDYYRSLDGVDRFRYSPKWLGRVPWQDLYLGFNYAWIDSEIDLGDSAGISTNSQRPLQGQSPYVGNLSLAYLPTDGKVEATLLYNVFGKRISQVGADGRPDTYEQPFKQLDFTLSAALPWDGWKLKLRLKNLLDPEATFTVGDEIARRFSKGREAAVSVEWRY
jgi:TonB-dependent receptor